MTTASDDRPELAGVVAVCDLAPHAGSVKSQSFSINEYLRLAGDHLLLRGDLGFTAGFGSSGDHSKIAASDVIRDVLNTVLPDDDAGDDDHPWELLAQLARDRGAEVTGAALREHPYEVHLTAKVIEWIEARQSSR